ncbi:MAG: HpaII family restriction endonuclease [Clostridia bacterium]|nr:HpaII family restriction endonuclease [Clostridia bacterium]
MIIGSKNKGDWSEFYVLLYLLGTGRLYAADEKLQRMDRYHFPIKKIYRKEAADERIVFDLGTAGSVEIYFNDEFKKRIPADTFRGWARSFLPRITAGVGSFSIPEAEEKLNSIYCKRLAAPSTDITDIKMQLHDPITGLEQIMGFSIKSYLGGAPTLLNASGATNFVYEIIGLNDRDIESINAIETRAKIQERIQAITAKGGIIVFRKPASSVFLGNLMMIDSLMEEIMGHLILYSYQTNELDCTKLIRHLEEVNPIGYPRKGYYGYKFKKFLCAKALGMDPAEVWNGVDDANGGYIVAKTDGEVVAYHLYNRDKFEQYLFENTRLERASTVKHDYAKIYKEKDKTYIKLNLQIRFKER